MKECKYSKILPCYRDGYGVWHRSDDIHDKVYGLNKQMCDLERGLSNDFSDMQVRIADKLAKDVVEGVRTPDWAKNMLAGIPEQLSRAEYEILDEILKEKNRPMKEKKTKKMTKAEAFEYLKGKKIKCYAGIANIFDEPTKVEKFLLEIGCRYHFANHIGWRDWYWPLYGFIVDSKGEIYVAFEDQMDFFKQNFNEPISVDEILSIEIVEENRSEDELVEIVELGKKIQCLLSKLSGHRHVVITETDVLLYDEGMSLFHSDPF